MVYLYLEQYDDYHTIDDYLENYAAFLENDDDYLDNCDDYLEHHDDYLEQFLLACFSPRGPVRMVYL